MYDLKINVMGIFDKIFAAFPLSEHPSYIPMLDTEDCGQMSADLWRMPPIDESDPAAIRKREEMQTELFAVFFGTVVEREQYGRKCFPFSELPPEALELMDPSTRDAYNRDLATASDPRSGRIVRPFLPKSLIEPSGE